MFKKFFSVLSFIAKLFLHRIPVINLIDMGKQVLL